MPGLIDLRAKNRRLGKGIAERKRFDAPIEAPLRRRAGVGLVVAVLLTIFVGFSSWRGFRRTEKDAYRVAKSISVVTMTFSSEGQHLVERYNLGVNRYVRKPVDFEQFQKTVKTLGPYWLVVNESSADGSSTAMTRASN
jgi:hypothetical protein